MTEKLPKPEEEQKGVDVSIAQTPQYNMSPQGREELQREINSLGHTPETASMAIANQNFEQLHQIETKHGLATEWQNDEVPLGRVMPRVVPADIEPLVQVETAPDGQADDIGDKTFHHDEIKELDSQYPDHLAPSHVRKEYFDLDAAVKESVASGDEGAQRIAMGRLDAFMTEQREGVRSEDMIDLEQKEGTPKEWRDKLRGLIEGAKEKLGMSERAEKMKGFLSKRSGELDGEAAKFGPDAEGWVTSSLKRYNALNWKTKLAVSAGLMGVTLAGAFIAPASALAMVAMPTLVAGQRAVGMAGFMIKRREAIDAKIQADPNHALAKSGELRKYLNAAGEATAYLALMGGATTALLYGGESALHIAGPAHAMVERVRESWLGNILGHHAPVATVHIEAPHAAVLPDADIKLNQAAIEKGWNDFNPGKPFPGNEIASADINKHMLEISMHPAAAAAASGEVAAPAIVSEIPGIEVKATPGHGYEYMLKRLWEDLNNKNIKLPENANPDSDLAQLLKVKPGDEAGINNLVHKLAQDNEFFKVDGTSAHINLDSKLTIDTKGQIWLDHKDILAPEGSVTPAYHTGAEVPHVSEATEGKNLNIIDDETRQHAQEFVAPTEIHGAQSEEVSGAETTNTLSTAQFAEILNRGSSIISPEFNTYFDKHYYDFSDGEILKIKTMLLDSIRNGENQNLKEIFAGKQPGDLKIGTYLGNIELITGTVDGQEVGASFKPNASFDAQMHINGLEPVIKIPVPEPPHTISPAWEQNYSGQETPVSIDTHEAPASSSISGENFIVNKYELSIPIAESHIYANESKSLFVYGGTADEKAKMIKEYLQAHQDAVIYAEGAKATRVPWYLTQGVIITEGKPVSEKDLLGIFSTFMKAPSPDDLKVLVK